jgi:hypothetical protein
MGMIHSLLTSYWARRGTYSEVGLRRFRILRARISLISR